MHTKVAFLSQIIRSYITLLPYIVMEQMGPLYFVNHPGISKIKPSIFLEDLLLLSTFKYKNIILAIMPMNDTRD